MVMIAQPSSNPSSLKVLVVDESPLGCLAVSSLIAQEPNWVVVGVIYSPSETLGTLDSIPADLVILELTNRNGAGLDLIKDLHLRHPRVRTLVLSYHSEELFALRALQAGASGFISKLRGLDEIRTAIRQVAAGSTYISREQAVQFAINYLNVGNLGTTSEINRLSNRELQVFRLLGEGQTTRAIAEALGISIKTVETYCDHLKRKLGQQNGVALARKAVLWAELGIIR